MRTIEPLQITFLRKLTATPAASGPLQVHPLPGRASSSSPPQPLSLLLHCLHFKHELRVTPGGHFYICRTQTSDTS